ncbi:MAG: apolipoprotein N-acyltransferase [Candidatus Methylumidiphilus sp.]
MRLLIPNLLALLGGLLLPLAFSPFDWAWLAPVCLCLLFASWLHATPLQAFARGYGFGLGQFGFGVSWVYLSMHNYGGASPLEAGGLTVLMTLYLALYPALAGWLAARLFGSAGKHRKLLLAFPACWVLAEWLRGWFFLDFSWLQLGSSQVGTVLGLGLAPLLGVYGVSFAVALLAGLGLSALDRDDWPRRGAMVAIGLLIVACAGLDQIEWTQPAGAPFKAALLQGNIAQGQKWRPEFQRATLNLYAEMSRQHWDAKLIVWPETAVPAFYHQVKDTWLADLRAEAAPHGADLIIGMPWVDMDTRQYYNAMVSVAAKPETYLKRHLVPFGEYLPFRPAFGWILDILEIPLSDFASGAAGQPPMHAAGYPLAASICYEDTLGHEARDALPQAAYLVNVTNDAWFGDSIAPHQHVQMARMRAVEAGRWLLRSTNSGITAAISPEGEIVGQAPLFQQAAVVAVITPMSGATPYVWWGDWAIIGVLAGLLVLLKIRPSRTVSENSPLAD